MKNFWHELPQPFLVMAPMEDVTDVVFREIMAEVARPDVFFTEFTSADGLFSPGHDVVIRKFKYTQNQRPIIAQIWGMNPENIFKAAELVREMGFDGLDINMGCPDKSVMKKGSGAALIGNDSLAKEIIDAARKGVGDLPISVKTRLGSDKIIIEEWMKFLLKQSIQAIAIHGRIAKQMSKGDANWDEIGKAVTLRNEIAPDIVMIGNGDVKSREEADGLHKNHGVDGVMIARGVFSNPWVFEKTPSTHDPASRIEIMLRHMTLFEKTWGRTKNFEILKKFFKMYVKDFDGANHLRQELMECGSSQEVIRTIQSALLKIPELDSQRLREYVRG